MTSDRCPMCGAATAPAASWCSLCYADLRVPVSVPAPEPAAVGLPEPVVAPAVPSLAPIADVVAAPESVDAAPEVPQPRGASWPCHLCGEPRGVTEAECPTCGAGLLPADPSPTLTLPGLGAMETESQRVVVMVAGAFIVTVILVAVLFIAGAFV